MDPVRRDDVQAVATAEPWRERGYAAKAASKFAQHDFRRGDDRIHNSGVAISDAAETPVGDGLKNQAALGGRAF